MQELSAPLRQGAIGNTLQALGLLEHLGDAGARSPTAAAPAARVLYLRSIYCTVQCTELSCVVQCVHYTLHYSLWRRVKDL